jgi:hypothetical protein
MSHTPHTWHCVKAEDSDHCEIWRIQDASSRFIAACNRFTNADVELDTCTKQQQEESEATAKLVASAPDLLAEAQRIRKILEGYLHGGENDHLLHWETLQELYLPLVDCIRKATGQTR